MAPTLRKRTLHSSNRQQSSIVSLECIQIDDEDDETTPMAVCAEVKNVGGIMDVSLPSAEWFEENWGIKTKRVNRKRKRKSVKSSSIVENGLEEPKTKKNKKKVLKREALDDDEIMIIEQHQAKDGLSAEVSEGEDLDTILPIHRSADEEGNDTENINFAEANSKDVETTDKSTIGPSTSASSVVMQLAKIEREDNNFSPEFLFEKILDNSNMEKGIKRELFNANEVESTHKGAAPLSSISLIKLAEYGVESNADRRIVKKIKTYRENFQKEFSKFNKQIWVHFTNNLQNDFTYIWKMRICHQLKTNIALLYPNCCLMAVGSTVNGCGAYNSDMDLCLGIPCLIEGFDTPRSYAVKHLKKVLRHLSKCDFIHQVQYIPAKVPILKITFRHPYKNLEVDMNINNIAGIYNSFLLHNYSRIDDRFPSLCLLIKHWAKAKGIGNASEGFLNSYSLILLVLHFLQCGVEPPILPNLQYLYPNHFRFNRPFGEMEIFKNLPGPLPEMPDNGMTVGELLIALFDYYNRFDFDRMAISIQRGCVFPRANLPANTDRFKLYIEEPFDYQNTARCVTGDEQWLMILDAFGKAAHAFCPSSKRPPELGLIGINSHFPI